MRQILSTATAPRHHLNPSSPPHAPQLLAHNDDRYRTTPPQTLHADLLPAAPTPRDRCFVTRTGIAIGILHRAAPPAPGAEGEAIQRLLLAPPGPVRRAHDRRADRALYAASACSALVLVAVHAGWL